MTRNRALRIVAAQRSYEIHCRRLKAFRGTWAFTRREQAAWRRVPLRWINFW